MITWQDIASEAQQTELLNPGQGIDMVRRAAYSEFAKKSGRPLLVYATSFQNPIKAANLGPLLSIDLNDKDGFQQIVDSIFDKKVDLLIHSPGGSAEATESLVEILRSKFTDIRIIVTGAAKSAATMLSMSGNSIIMSSAGELGPIDPQINLGGSYTPAGSLIEEFNKAADEVKDDPEKLPVWLPILDKYPPALLTQCDNFLQLAKDLVKEWLEEYMFKGDAEKEKKAEKIAAYLANEKNTLSHARRIDYKELKKLGAKVEQVEAMPNDFQEALRKVHLSVIMTLDNTDAIKIYESSEGGALIRTFTAIPPQAV